MHFDSQKIQKGLDFFSPFSSLPLPPLFAPALFPLGKVPVWATSGKHFWAKSHQSLRNSISDYYYRLVSASPSNVSFYRLLSKKISSKIHGFCLEVEEAQCVSKISGSCRTRLSALPLLRNFPTPNQILPIPQRAAPSTSCLMKDHSRQRK